jgi:hypothetical protein
VVYGQEMLVDFNFDVALTVTKRCSTFTRFIQQFIGEHRCSHNIRHEASGTCKNIARLQMGYRDKLRVPKRYITRGSASCRARPPSFCTPRFATSHRSRRSSFPRIHNFPYPLDRSQRSRAASLSNDTRTLVRMRQVFILTPRVTPK